MKSFAVLLFGVLCAAATLAPQGAHAASPRIPATVYPQGAHISYRPSLTNADVDCLWGFVCEAELPNFHFSTQDELHRLSGWGEFAGVRQHGHLTMAFELFVSQYDPVPAEKGGSWSTKAFLDLRASLRVKGYVLRRETGFPAMPWGNSLVAIEPLGDQDLVVMALWSGTLEIEGIALYDHSSATAKQTAWSSLVLQVREASTLGS